MNNALLRQLKRTMGVANSDALAEVLAQAQSESAALSPAVRQLLEGLGDFVGRVESSYEQYERDLELRTRSLEISSQELSAVNDAIRRDLESREHALYSLRSALHGLLPSESEGSREIIQEKDLAVLSNRIAELVLEQARGQRALSNQKFALDQHAIVSITNLQGDITLSLIHI